jgi:hypothetical protein
VATVYTISRGPASVDENSGRPIFAITRSTSSAAATIYARTVRDHLVGRISGSEIRQFQTTRRNTLRYCALLSC